MRKLLLLSVVLLSIGCAKSRQSCSEWPAAVTTLQGFTESEQTSVIEGIEALNQRAESPLVLLEGQGQGFELSFHRVSPDPQKLTRVGYAVRKSCQCRIELSSAIFNSRPELKDSVLWHEIGHCAGLVHSNQQNAVMFHTTKPFRAYSTSAIDFFIEAIFRAIRS